MQLHSVTGRSVDARLFWMIAAIVLLLAWVILSIGMIARTGNEFYYFRAGYVDSPNPNAVLAVRAAGMDQYDRLMRAWMISAVMGSIAAFVVSCCAILRWVLSGRQKSQHGFEVIQ